MATRASLARRIDHCRVFAHGEEIGGSIAIEETHADHVRCASRHLRLLRRTAAISATTANVFVMMVKRLIKLRLVVLILLKIHLVVVGSRVYRHHPQFECPVRRTALVLHRVGR